MKIIHFKNKKRRKLRSEAVVILTLGSLLLFLISSMTISFLVRSISLTQSEPKDVVALQDTPVIRQENTKGLIVIDPGHGGYDAGCEANGIYEKYITLAIAKYMGTYLEEQNYQVIFTREEDIALGTYEMEDLQNRVYVGSYNQADFFVSLHLNFTDITSERIYGFDVFANQQLEASSTLADNIIQSLSDLNYSQSRGVQNGEIMHVVDKNYIPAVLVEMGFASDAQDFAFLTSNAGQKAIGEAMGKAVIKTKE